MRHGTRTTARALLRCWLALFLTTLAWTLATPVLAGPDEFAHVIKAAAVVRGQLLGEQVAQPGEYFPVITVVELPEHYASARSVVGCYAFHPEVPAACAPAFEAHDGEPLAAVETSVGRYPPLYYAAVGWPSLLLDGEAAVYGMRVVAAALTSLLIALGLVALTAGRAPPLLLGCAAGLTPMVFFLSGVVNPSGLEAAAGFATWAVALSAVLAPDAADLHRRLTLAAVAAAVLISTRASSPLIGLLVVAVLVAVAGRRFWQRALAGRRWVPAVVIGLSAGAVAAVWVLLADPDEGLGGRPVEDFSSPLNAARAAMARTPWYLHQVVGVFGYLDAPAPLVVVAAFAVLVAALVIAALVRGRRSDRFALLLAGALVLLVPVVLQVPTAERLGLIWQGRYLLALTAGVPLVAAAVLVRTGSRWPGPLTARVGVVAALAAHLVALVVALHRFSSGTAAPVWALAGPWQPPITSTGAVLVAVVGLVLLGRALQPAARRAVSQPASATSASTGSPSTVFPAPSGTLSGPSTGP